MGRAPLVKLLFMLGWLSPKFLYQSCFSKRIDLASNVLYGIAKMDFLTTIWLLRSLQMLAIHYITIKLNYHVSIFKIMGVAANGPHTLSALHLEPPLLEFLEIPLTTSPCLAEIGAKAAIHSYILVCMSDCS